jgi:hypothetical protein
VTYVRLAVRPFILRKQLVVVLADAFQQKVAVDPIFTLQLGVPIDIPVTITLCESPISFVSIGEDPYIDLTVQRLLALPHLDSGGFSFFMIHWPCPRARLRSMISET